VAAGRPRVFSIPPGAAFLPALAEALLAGRLVPGWPDRSDPLSLAEGLILLPTRRAARALAAHLGERAGGGTVLLPRIVPLGDVDEAEEERLFDGDASAATTLGDTLTLPPETSEGRRRLVLARLILAWAKTVDRRQLKLEDGESLLVPAGPADALALAADLGRLIDTFSIYGKTFEDLHRLVPDDFSAYWSISRDFLVIAAEHWPALCRDMGTMDAALRRHQLLTTEAERLLRVLPAGPVVAAGSTGSMPATAALLGAIARLPRGAVVLPGLDRHLEPAAWSAVSGAPGQVDHPGHPQAILARLIQGFGLSRDVVEVLGSPSPALAAREAFLAEALRPAETTDAWRDRDERLGPEAVVQALADVTVVEAGDDREEALAIAAAMRGALEDPEATAALVTPDRSLAERVSAELRRWGIEVDDSAGKPLARTGPGIVARLVAEAAAGEGEPLSLLALLAHPACRLGLPGETVQRGRAALEIGLFRGPALPRGWDRLRPALDHAISRAGRSAPGESASGESASGESASGKSGSGKSGSGEPAGREAGPRRRLAAGDWQAARAVLAGLERAFADFDPARLPRLLDLPALAALHEAALAVVTEPPPGKDVAPAPDDAEAELAAAFDEVRTGSGSGIEGAFAEYPAFFTALLSGRAARGLSSSHRRLRIWGPLESRLLESDLVILGGLDEKTWPPETRGDAFLNRPLREQLGLPALERRIGQTAHDFVQSLGSPRAIITRAHKRGGDPTVPSRFLQRMRAVAGEQAWAPVLARGAALLEWARRLDRPDRVESVRRPAPRPPAELQPVQLSVTEIETLVRDPYAVYARHVLRLDPLDDIALPPSAAVRGTLIHGVLGEFAKAYPDTLPADVAGELVRLGVELFDATPELHDRPDVRAFWWPRFLRVVAWMERWERGRRAPGVRVVAETKGRHLFGLDDGTGFTLTARADRFEERPDGALAVIDFKTGAMPGVKEVQVGFSPQLTLEAAMAREGAFEAVPGGRRTEALLYVQLGGGTRAGSQREITPGEGLAGIDDLALQHLSRLRTLLSELRTGERAFLSRPVPKFAKRYAPYDHLARVREWSLLGQDGDGGEEP
jgi:ATP-dependent helicase/nuclease subunit B